MKVAEQALGKPLPMGCEVHHVDGNKRNNDNANLVICQDRRYHMLLHTRARVVRAGGNPNTDAYCSVCHTAKPLASFYKRGDGGPSGWCIPCHKDKHDEWRKTHRRITRTIDGVVTTISVER